MLSCGSSKDANKEREASHPTWVLCLSTLPTKEYSELKKGGRGVGGVEGAGGAREFWRGKRKEDVGEGSS
jgi:hypothetical protein